MIVLLAIALCWGHTFDADVTGRGTAIARTEGYAAMLARCAAVDDGTAVCARRDRDYHVDEDTVRACHETRDGWECRVELFGHCQERE